MHNTLRFSTKELVIIGVFAALSAVLSQISIPIGSVPVNLTHISIFLAAGLLGCREGIMSQIVFVVMGVVGLPVFSGFSGGFNRLLGPTGGFIAGYIGCVIISATIIRYYGKSVKALIPAMLCGSIITYILGISWLMYSLNLSLLPAITAYMLPFIPGDMLKIAVSTALIRRLDPILSRTKACSH